MDKVENLNSGMCAVSANPQLSVTYGTSFHNQITINEEPMLDYVLPKLDSSPSYYLVDTSISQSSSFPGSDVQYNPSISPSSGSVGDYQVSENLEMQLPNTNHEQTCLLNNSSSSSFSPVREMANFSSIPNCDTDNFEADINIHDLLTFENNGEYQLDAVPIRKIEHRNLGEFLFLKNFVLIIVLYKSYMFALLIS